MPQNPLSGVRTNSWGSGLSGAVLPRSSTGVFSCWPSGPLRMKMTGSGFATSLRFHVWRFFRSPWTTQSLFASFGFLFVCFFLPARNELEPASLSHSPLWTILSFHGEGTVASRVRTDPCEGAFSVRYSVSWLLILSCRHRFGSSLLKLLRLSLFFSSLLNMCMSQDIK